MIFVMYFTKTEGAINTKQLIGIILDIYAHIFTKPIARHQLACI